jgi:uncharacterized protein (TIGR03000 family)
MSRVTGRLLLMGAIVAVALSIEATQANAQCCGAYRPAVWSSYYAPVYYAPARVAYRAWAWDSCCTGDWYLGWRHGPIRRAFFGPYRWYWGASGWCASCTCGTCDTCCDGAAVTSSGPSATQPTPAGAPTPAKKPAIDPPASPTPATEPAPALPTIPQPAEPKSSSLSPDTKGTLTVWVPSDAKVTVNGRETTSTGARRQFVSNGLKPGFSYKYVIKATVVQDGQVVEDTRTVVLTAGQVSAIAFDFAATNLQVAAAH